MSDSTDPRSARAEAKAASARAKALRPWWKKKRTWIGAIVLLLIVAVVASAGGEDDEKKPNNAGTASTLGDESGEDTDVEITVCKADALGFTSIEGTATNSSSKRSDYLMDIVIEKDGVQVGTANGFVENVEAGQTAKWDTSSFDEHEAGATCRLVDVERNASL